MKATLVIELELHGDPGSDEALDTWSWSVERQLEELALVKSASVVDATFPTERGG